MLLEWDERRINVKFFGCQALSTRPRMLLFYARNYIAQSLYAVGLSTRSYGSQLIRFKCGREPLGKMEVRVWTMRGLSTTEG